MKDSYLYEFNKSRYRTLANRQLPKKTDLICKVVENGYLLPARYAERILFGRGGVAAEDGKFVQESAMYANAKSIEVEPCTENEIYLGEGYEFDGTGEDVPYLDEDVIYLGYINNHWGHFLLDSVNRLYYAISYQKEHKCRLAYIVNENCSYRMIPNIRRFFELAGINPEEILFINRLTRAKRIFLPEQSYCIDSYYSQEFLDLFDRVANAADTESIAPADRVYYTRGLFGKARETECGEEIFVDLFQKNGFEIVSPERMTLDQQIALIRGSNLLAMEIGTIPHNLLFAEPGKKVILLNKSHNMNTAQMDINLIRAIDATYIDAYEACYPVPAGDGPFLLTYSEPLQKFVADENWKQPEEALVTVQAGEKRARQYERNFRRRYYHHPEMRFCRDKKRFDYFSPELLTMYQEHYYRCVRPYRIGEILDIQWRRVKRKLGK